MSRSARTWLATVLVAGLAGCAGQGDLSKTVTPRTTVKAVGSFNDEALRMVEPCGLLTDEVVNSIGKRRSTSNPNRTGYSECNMPITDAETGKQTINLTIKVGADLLSTPKQTAKSFRGLGVYETRSSASCTQNAITSNDRGIVAQVYWDSGETCGPATKLLESAIRQIAEKPPVYQDTPGSLVKLDPCALVDDAAAKAVLGATGEKSPYGIRTCIVQANRANVTVEYTIDFEPVSANRTREPVTVDVNDKIKGAAQYRGLSQSKCYVEWVHRALSGNRGENVRLSYERSPANTNEDPCAKALETAKLLAGKLPAG